MELPQVTSANDIDSTELSVILRRSNVADILDFVDADEVEVTVKPNQTDYQYERPQPVRDPYTTD